jgi:hypothetical protein
MTAAVFAALLLTLLAAAFGMRVHRANTRAATIRQAALQRATPAFLRDATPQTVDLYYNRVESRRWST